MTDRLHIRQRKGVGLAEAIAALDVPGITRDGAVALVYAPGFCMFGRLKKDGKLVGPPDLSDLHEQAMKAAYEARLFCADWELRWVRDGASGRAAFLAEDDSVVPEGFVPAENGEGPQSAEAAPGAFEGSWPNRYLLWGERAEPSEEERRRLNGNRGWTKLTAARIGTLWVPYAEEPGGRRIQLTTIEYWRRGPHGNVAICEERLTGFRYVAEGGRQPADNADAAQERSDG